MKAPVEPGQVLADKYRVERVIGVGGMGVVVAATHLELGGVVAMKFLLAEGMGLPEVAARFIREARAAARIRSEHVARVIDVGRLDSGSPYIVMEYLEGRDLEALLQQGPIAVEDAVDYVIQACDAMAEAHHLGIVHRDLKPANLFLANTLDGLGIVKVLDFGISKSLFDAAPASLTKTSALVGSPLYMSPEQMRSSRDVDHRTDIWSLGAVLFELLTGRPPFEADSIGALMAIVLTEAPPSARSLRPDLPEGLAEVLARCLERDVAVRFADVAKLSAALTPFAPSRSLPAVERVQRILGTMAPPSASMPPSPFAFRSSTPPGRGLSSLPAPRVSTAPASPSIPPPASLPSGLIDAGARTQHGAAVDSPSSFSPAATAGAVGHRTTSGWGGIEAKSGSKGSRLGLVIGVPVVGLLLAAGFFVFSGGTRRLASDERAAPSAPVLASPGAPVVPPPLASAPPAPATASATVAPLVALSATLPDASAAPAASAPAAPLARSPGPRAPKPAPRPANPAENPSPEPRGGESRLRMELKR